MHAFSSSASSSSIDTQGSAVLVPPTGNVGVMIKVQVVNVGGDASSNGLCSTAQCQLPSEAASAGTFGQTTTVSIDDVSGDDCASHRTGSPVNWPQAEFGDTGGFAYNGSPMSKGFQSPNMGSLVSVPELAASDHDIEDPSITEVADESHTNVFVDNMRIESTRGRLGTDVTAAFPVRNGFIQYKVPYDDSGADMRISICSAPTELGSRRWSESRSELPSLPSLPESVRASVRSRSSCSSEFWHSQDYWGASRSSGIRTSSVPPNPDGVTYEQRWRYDEQWTTGQTMNGVGSYSRVRSGSIGRRSRGARSQERRCWADEQWNSQDNWASSLFKGNGGHFPASRSASADTQIDGSPSIDVFSSQTPSGLWTTGPCAELRAAKAEAHGLRADLEDSRAETRAIQYELDAAREQLRQESTDADRRCEEIMSSLEAHLRFELGLAEARWRAAAQPTKQEAGAAIDVAEHPAIPKDESQPAMAEADLKQATAVPKPPSHSGHSLVKQDAEVEKFKIGWDHKKARRLFYKGPEPRRPVSSLADFLAEYLPPQLPQRCSASHAAKEFELTLEWVSENDCVSAEDMVGIIQRTIKDVIEATLERPDGTSGRNIVGGIKATRCPLMPGSAADAAAERATTAARKAAMLSPTCESLESSDVSPCRSTAQSTAQSSWMEASPLTLPLSPPAVSAALPPTLSPTQSPTQSPTRSLTRLPPQPPAPPPKEVVPKSCNGVQPQSSNSPQSPVRRAVPTASRPHMQTNRQRLHTTVAIEALANAGASVAQHPKIAPVPTCKARAFSDATTAGSHHPSSASSRGCATDADARSWTTDTSLEGRLIECADEHEQPELPLDLLRREVAPLNTPIAERSGAATRFARQENLCPDSLSADSREPKLQSGDAWCTSM